MESKKTSFWITYRDSDSSPTDSDTYGKWVCTFTDRSRIAQICQDAVAEHIIPESKYTDADAGQCCFYLNGTDLATQEKVLRYLILNGLIPETVMGDSTISHLNWKSGLAGLRLSCSVWITL